MKRLDPFALAPRLIWGIAILAVGIRVGIALTTHFTSEDYLITLRYAENLAQGHGLVYNPGERVLGTTTPLYTLFLALMAWSGLPATLCGKAINILADGVLCLLMYRWMQESAPKGEGQIDPGTANAPVSTADAPPGELSTTGTMAALWVACNPLAIQWSLSGMETSLVTLCGVWAILLWTQRRSGGMYLVLAVLFLLRWDSVLLTGVLTAATLWRDRRLPLREIALFALLIAPWILFATVTYGNPIPVTGRAKMTVYGWRADTMPTAMRRNTAIANGGSLSFLARCEPDWLLRACPQQMKLLHHFAGTPGYALLLLCALVGLYRLWRARQTAMLPPLLWFAVYWLAFLVSRVLLFDWYLLPTLPVYGALAAVGLAWLIRRLCGEWPSLLKQSAAWGLIVLLMVASTRLTFLVCRETQSIEDNERRPIGLWLQAHSRPTDRIMLEPIGYIGYYSRRRVIDVIGLVSPEVLSAYTPQNPAPVLTLARRYQPEWCVLRPGELQRVQTVAQADGRPWEADYALAQTYAYTPRPDRDRIIFYIFHRKSPSASPAPAPENR